MHDPSPSCSINPAACCPFFKYRGPILLDGVEVQSLRAGQKQEANTSAMILLDFHNKTELGASDAVRGELQATIATGL